MLGDNPTTTTPTPPAEVPPALALRTQQAPSEAFDWHQESDSGVGNSPRDEGLPSRSLRRWGTILTSSGIQGFLCKEPGVWFILSQNSVRICTKIKMLGPSFLGALPWRSKLQCCQTELIFLGIAIFTHPLPLLV